MSPVVASHLERAASLFHALSDETRLRIIACLADGEQCVCNLTDTLDTSQSRLSFHLRTLKEAGLLRDRRQGRWVYYALEPAVVEEAHRMLETMAPVGRLALARGGR